MQDFGLFVSGQPKIPYSSPAAQPAAPQPAAPQPKGILTQTGKPLPWRYAFFIAFLVTLSSIFTYYLPDNLPNSDVTTVLAHGETNYDFWRFVGGTYVGALLALLGGNELVKRYDLNRTQSGQEKYQANYPSP